MSTTSNLKLNKHDNVSTNTNPFDIENYLNVNWDKIDKYAGNSNSTILKLQEENARLKKTIQTELEERTIEAESIEVNDSAEANCEIDLQGNTTQETTTGKNALNIFSRYQVGQKTSINGIDFVVNKDGSVTANGTATDDAAFIIATNSNLGQDAFNGTYILNGCPTGGSLQSYRQTIWIKGDKTYSDFGNGVQFTKSENGSWNNTIIIYKGTKVANLIFKPMIRLATITDDTFEKYTGGEASPNPDYPSKVETVTGSVELKIRNKNFINLKNGTKVHNGVTVETNNGIINSNGTASSNSFNTIYLEEPITLKANQTYVLSANNEITIGATNTSSNYASLRLQYNSTPINNTDAILGNKNAFKSFTFTEDTLVDSVVVRTDQGLTMNNFIIKPQLEKDKSTDFVQHKEQIYSLYLPFDLCKIGEYKDYIFKENNKWYKHKDIEKIILNGSEQWTLKNNDETNYCYSISSITNYKHATLSNYGFSNFFNVGRAYGSDDALSRGVGLWFYTATGSNIIYLVTNKATTVNDLKNWLSNNNTTVYYVLEAPVDEEITDTTLIRQLNELENAMSYYGTTYVDTTNEVIKLILKFTYNRSNRLRIETLEKAIINS